jgi:cytochrome b561/polyisoprenoid-binding protein YceI
MQFTNSEDRYGAISKTFHWVIAFIILGLIPVGFGMGLIPNSPLKFEVYAMHKSFGLLVFFLALARLTWRFFSPAPDRLETHKGWEHALASAAHVWLYICMIGMPLSGWLMSSANEFPVPFFGTQLPHIIEKNEEWAPLFRQSHTILGYSLFVILALHMAGALKHHILDRDETLQRMSWRKAGIGLAALLVLLAGTSYALSVTGIVKSAMEERAEKIEESKAEDDARSNDSSNARPDAWQIVADKSKVSFKTALYGAQFTTEITDISGDIVFDPENLEKSDVRVRVGTQGLKSGDDNRDANMMGPEWLDSENYPDIWFVSEKFEKGDGDKYVAIGTLSVKGKAMPLIMPFNLSIKGAAAHMTSEVSLNRLDYQIGTGNWSDEQTVGHNVIVQIDLSAKQ